MSLFSPNAKLSVRAKSALFESAKNNQQTRQNCRQSLLSDDGAVASNNENENESHHHHHGTMMMMVSRRRTVAGSTSCSSTFARNDDVVVAQHAAVAASRRPLSVLSPNHSQKHRHGRDHGHGGCGSQSKQTTTSTVTTRKWSIYHQLEDEQGPGNETIRMQKDIVELRRRIEILDSDTNRNDLLDLIQARESESMLKDEQLEQLNKKLHQIQKGLDDIELERQQLTARTEQLESEKLHLQEQLINREKEIMSLTRRCSIQADKIKETTRLQTTNRELQITIDELRDALQRRETESNHVNLLEGRLAQSLELREELKRKLEELKQDHDITLRKLKECLGNVEKLAEEKREWEEERRRLTQRGQLDMRQQRLDHVQSTMVLNEDLLARDLRIADLEKLLRNKNKHVEDMGKELIALKANQTNVLQRLADRYEYQIFEIHQNQKAKIDEYENTVTQLQIKLDEKKRYVAVLQEEVSTNMLELMCATGSLEKVHEECEMFDQMAADIEALEEERSSLEEMLHGKDTEIAELSADVCRLELEKELLIQDVERLQDIKSVTAKTGEGQKELQDRLTTLIEAQETIQQLKDRIETINACHEAKMVQSEEQHNQVCRSLREQIVSTSDKLSRMEAAVSSRDDAIATLKKELVEARDELIRTSNAHTDALSAIQIQLLKANTSSAIKDDEIRDLRVIELNELQDENNNLKRRLLTLQQKVGFKQNENDCIQDDLKSTIQQLRFRMLENEQRNESRRLEYERDMKMQSQAFANLRREHEFLKLNLQDREWKIEEVRADLTMTTDQLHILEKRDKELSLDCQQLQEKVQYLQAEKDVLQVALDNHQDRYEKQSETHRELRKQCTDLQQEVDQLEAKLVRHEEQTAHMEDQLFDRSMAVTELGDQKRVLETTSREQEMQLAKLTEEISSLRLQIVDRDIEIQQMKSEWQHKEDEYLAQLDTERNMREIMEADLTQIVSKNQHLQRDLRDISELEKENVELHNKVRRQEAYLMRKMEKDKALRARSYGITGGVVGGGAGPTNMTPGGGQGSVFGSGGGGGNGSKPPIGGTKSIFTRTSQGTRSTECSELSSQSLDWELDCLLAD